MALPALVDALIAPLLDPTSRTWWAGLLTGAGVAGIFWIVRRPAWRWSAVRDILRDPSTGLDVQLYLARQLLAVVWGSSSIAAGWLLATHAVRWLDRTLGTPAPPELSAGVVTLLFSVTLFIVWDASRWITHWLMHRVPALWAFHQVHHSASVLTPLTFHRLHPVESLAYQLRGALSTALVTAPFYWLFRSDAVSITLIGVPIAGLVLNGLFGNLRHSHVWLRFPVAVERWLVSPAQHQLHHSAQSEHFDANYGTWLAIWDRMAGTWLAAPEAPPTRFGIPEATRNHGDDLLSAWLGPFTDLRLRRVLPVALLSLLALPAHAQDEEEEEEEEEYGTSMVVLGEDGTPRVAGSAHRIEEETLQQYEFNNIERVLSMSVPGVNTRNEDGFGLRPNIGIRGANSDRSAKITLMEDGVLLAPAPYAAPAAYYFPMSTRMVGVEVFKGPAATRYGPHTVGGAINMLTRPVPKALDYQLDTTAGLWRTARVHGYAGASRDGAGLLIEGVRLRSDGFKVLDTGGPTGFNRSELMAKGRLPLGARHRLELKLGYANETSHETYLGLSAADYEADPYRRYASSAMGLMEWDRSQVEVAWPVQINDQLQLRTVAYHHWLGRSWTKFNGFADGTDAHDLLQLTDPGGQAAVYLGILQGEEDTVSDDQLLLIGTNDRRFQSFGVQSQARWRLYGESVSSSLTGGIRLHGDVVRRLHTEAPFAMLQGALAATDEPTETTLDSYATARALAVHVHEDLRIEKLHLLPGVRLEAVETYRADEGEDAADPIVRATLLPGLGVMRELGPWLSAFAGAHRGFSPVAPGQPAEVEPELSWNYEL
ncbi:MAG: sterol desaturase/sphingolipid hydroxylase (fatty acid hydroxylase superfamily), partial [Myxococcota bacterium]